MRSNSGSKRNAVPERHMSRFRGNANHAESLGFPAMDPGQSDPRHCPHRDDMDERPALSPLGAALTIEDVAELLGCSAWTVRQRYLPQGLPHLRASATGKFVFFRQQIVSWILKRQEKGGQK